MANPDNRQTSYLRRLQAGDPATRRALWPCAVVTPVLVAVPKIDSHLVGLTARSFAHGKALDLFSGSGVVAAWLDGMVDSVHCCDISNNALDCARVYLATMSFRSTFERADVFPAQVKKYDVVTANPPYSNKEPKSEADRICYDPEHTAVRKLIERLDRFLSDDGCAFISWPSFESFWKFEDFVALNGSLESCIVAEIVESHKSSERSVVYRVYKISKV